MMIGAGRIHEAACALSFDKNLYPVIDQTIIVSPYSWVTLTDEFKLFDIDCSTFKFYSDTEIIKEFNLEQWGGNHWYLQQGIKLSLLDSINDNFLIQDCDVFAIKPYNYFIDQIPAFRVEELWNDYQQVYAGKVKDLLGFERIIPYSFVTEFMPYLKEDWESCKQLIEEKFKLPWQQAILNISPFDDTKWLSEYELLGIYKTNKDNNYKIIVEQYPKILTMEDFFTVDWSQLETVKFKARPLKCMNSQEAQKIKSFFNRKENVICSN